MFYSFLVNVQQPTMTAQNAPLKIIVVTQSQVCYSFDISTLGHRFIPSSSGVVW